MAAESPTADFAAWSAKAIEAMNAQYAGLNAKIDAMAPKQFTPAEIAIAVAAVAFGLLILLYLRHLIKQGFAKMASPNLTALTASVTALSAAVTSLVGQVNTLIAASGDDAALPSLQATVDGLTSQANAALASIPAPPPAA